ncbi:nucleoside-diphosphate-sugar epimerase [Campylobacter iguaniorum]|uniref:NAD-dependent epimerase/dehydratase family protein n=1 Tax=Campylobacter iguaniorum TaxID=1244531 RepID=UPI00073A3354|nr:SDR family oxidoreductase [Campylobacter iguaniorum]ALV23672.1 nucleoside-diphosphate-sugar epimerase [Campylobacter iguaniorum]
MILIIGKRCNLTTCIQEQNSNTISFSTDDILQNIGYLDKFKNEKITILFNNFQAANKLWDIDNISSFVDKSIVATARVLDYIKYFTNIQKIIYASSSSIYGDNECCKESDAPHPINLQASLKLSNEFFIKQYCNKYNIDYTILRIFNMYGKNDNFSIISKIIKAAKNKEIINLINNGTGIRDFIHVDDVVSIIMQVVNISNLPILNVGTGEKKSIKNIIDYLSENHIKLGISNISNDNEIKISIANTKLLKTIFTKEFIKVQDYILQTLNEEEW